MSKQLVYRLDSTSTRSGPDTWSASWRVMRNTQVCAPVQIEQAREPGGAHLPVIPQQVACRGSAGMTAISYGRAGATVRAADAAECQVRLMPSLVTILRICFGIGVAEAVAELRGSRQRVA